MKMKLSYLWLILLLGSSLPGTVVAVEDPWPLFHRADRLLHGTVVQRIEGERDRLYLVATDGGSAIQSLESWWLREPEGEGTEGIGALVGHRGVWLVAEANGGEFPEADATVLPGGLFPLRDPSLVGALEQLLDPACNPSVALDLMTAADPICRRIAIGWWQAHGPDLQEQQVQKIRDAFLADRDASVQRSWIELFLQKSWLLKSNGMADLIPHSDDPAVSMLALQYLQSHGTVRQKARLVSAWPSTDLSGKKRLAIAYRTLAIREAGPWLLQGVTSNDPILSRICIESMGAAGLVDCQETYRSLLHSTSNEIRIASLRGLARSSAPGAWQMISETIASLEASDPILPLATQLQKHPWKFLRTRGKH